MAMEDHLQELLLRRSDNPHKDELCPCKRGFRLVRCHWDGCFQYPTSCENCFVEQHRHNPFHWALVWKEGVWTKQDFSNLLHDTNYIQLGHVEDQLPCSGAGPSRKFFVTHINGVHTTRIRFCGCPSAPSSKVDQLILSDLFPATPNEPESAFTLALLKQFRVHNLQSKCGAFDYIRSIRRFTDNAFTAKVPVSSYCYSCILHTTDIIIRIPIKVFFEYPAFGMFCRSRSGVVLPLG